MSRAPRGRAGAYRRCARALTAAGASGRQWRLWVPGRIEVLGKHTDYAGGRSILCALDRGFCAVAQPRPDPLLRILDVAAGTTFVTPLTADAAGRPGTWTHYATTAVQRLARDLPGLTAGVDLAFVSDLPIAAGMSSSSAMMVMWCMAIARANGIARRADFRRSVGSREAWAAYMGAIENGRPFGPWVGDAGVGTMGGAQDHTAILCSEAGRLVRYRWSPLQREATRRMPAGFVFALASCGVAAPKTAEAMARYNRVSLAAQRLTALWNERTHRRDATLGAALAGGHEAERRLRDLAAASDDPSFSETYLAARLEQFARETNDVIPAAWSALAQGDVTGFGEQVDRSQRLAEHNLGNQIAETVALQRSARELGAAAASAFGAGFGGSVWALVRQRSARAFLARWRAAYAAAFPHRAPHAEFFLSAASRAATWL